jgi:hypothetical protein
MIEKTVYGNMEWWDVAEQPDDFESLPIEFKEAFDLWQEDGEKNFEKIVSLLEGFLAGHFVAENIYDHEEFFAFESFPEAESYELQLVGVSFEDATPLPKVKTQARFRVPFSDDVNFESLEEDLKDKGSHLCDCISFRWVLDELDDYDTSFGDNLGTEALLLED